MNRRWYGIATLLAVCIGCTPKLPSFTDKEPGRMLDPKLSGDGTVPVDADEDAVPVRLLGTEARGHIRQQILHRSPDGEVMEDAIWRWSTTPDRYLETALYLEAASNPRIRIADTSSAATLAATLLACHIESTPGSTDSRLRVAVELRIADREHSVRARVLQAEEAISGGLPGNLAEVTGRLMRRLAAECLSAVVGAP